MANKNQIPASWDLGFAEGSVPRLCLSFFLACASLFVSLVPPVLVHWDMLDDHCYQAFIAMFVAKGFSLMFFFVFVCVRVPALRVCCFVLSLLLALFGAWYDRTYVVHGLAETGVGVVWECVWCAWVA